MCSYNEYVADIQTMSQDTVSQSVHECECLSMSVLSVPISCSEHVMIIGVSVCCFSVT